MRQPLSVGQAVWVSNPTSTNGSPPWRPFVFRARVVSEGEDWVCVSAAQIHFVRPDQVFDLMPAAAAHSQAYCDAANAQQVVMGGPP